MDLKTDGCLWTSAVTELVHFNGVDWYLLVPPTIEWQDMNGGISAFPKLYQTEETWSHPTPIWGKLYNKHVLASWKV